MAMFPRVSRKNCRTMLDALLLESPPRMAGAVLLHIVSPYGCTDFNRACRECRVAVINRGKKRLVNTRKYFYAVEHLFLSGAKILSSQIISNASIILRQICQVDLNAIIQTINHRSACSYCETCSLVKSSAMFLKASFNADAVGALK